MKSLSGGGGRKDSIFNAAGLFSLGEVLAFFLFCDAFLTNDSGLMNLAFAQGAKTVSLFGNNMFSFVHIDNGVNIAIYKPSYCSPCLYVFDKAPCGDKPFCMENIKTEDAIDAVSKILKTKDVKHSIADKYAVINEQSKYLFGTLRKGK